MTGITPARTFCWGILHAIGMFDLSKVVRPEKREEPGGLFAVGDLTNEEKLDCGEEKAWFGFGEVLMAGLLASCLAVPAGFWFAGMTDPPLAFIGAAILFLPLFVFLPKLIRQAMAVDTDAIFIAFGKNDKVKKVFWTIFLALAGLVLARVVDPGMAQQVLAALAGLGT